MSKVILSPGNSATITLTNYDSITVETRGQCDVDAVSGLGLATGRIASFSGTRTIGPYAAGQIKLSASGADVAYEVADGDDQGVVARVVNDASGNQVLVGADGKAITDGDAKYSAIRQLPGLIAFWDFAEPRAPFYSKAGRGRFPLVNAAGSRVKKGSSGPIGNSLVFNGTTDYLTIPAASIGELNIGKRGNAVSVIAWIKRANGTFPGMLAGIWGEDSLNPSRQYALFVDLSLYGGDNKVCFHVSKTGGPSPNLPYSRDYSSNGSTEPGLNGDWISGTYDGSFARSYIEGRFEPYLGYTEPGAPNGEGLTYDKNPYAFSLGLNSRDAEFTVGACKLSGGYGNFFGGELACLAIFESALTAAQLAAFQNALNNSASGFKHRLFKFAPAMEGVSSLFGCKAYRGATAIDESASSSGVYTRQTAGTPAQGFVFRGSSSAAGAGLFVCESIAEGVTTANLASIKAQFANVNSADAVRLCLKIGSSWYASEATFGTTTSTASGGDWSLAETKTLDFDPAAANWRDIALAPGSSLALAGAVRSSALPSGAVTGWGVYTAATPTGHIRFRDVELITL